MSARITESQFQTLTATIDDVIHSIPILDTKSTEVQPESIPVIHSGRRGGPQMDVNREHLELLLLQGYTVSAIAREGLLGACVHRNTVVNHIKRHGLLQPKVQHNVSTDDLRAVIADHIKGHPNSGHMEVRAYLRTRDPPIFVARQRVRDMMSELDPEGVAGRWAQVVERRRYSVKSPNSLWHIDGHHALVRYGFYVHGGIDGFSRLIPYLRCSAYNTAACAFGAFVSGVQLYGIPSRVRLDHGVENGIISTFMEAANGDGRGSAIAGRSVHNQRIERLWRDVFSKVVHFYYTTLTALEDSLALDLSNPLHVYAAQLVFLPRINASLEEWRVARNNQGVRTEAFRTPEQLWFTGMLREGRSQSSGTALQNVTANRDVREIVHGVKPDLDFDQLTSINVSNTPRSIPQVTAELRAELLDRLDVNRPSDRGIEIYGDVVEFLLQHCT